MAGEQASSNKRKSAHGTHAFTTFFEHTAKSIRLIFGMQLKEASKAACRSSARQKNGLSHAGLQAPQRAQMPRTTFLPLVANWVRTRYSAAMNAIAETIDQRLRSLPASQAKKLEGFLLLALDLFGVPETKPAASRPVQPYTLPSWNLGVRPGLDLTKLAHVDEDDLAK